APSREWTAMATASSPRPSTPPTPRPIRKEAGGPIRAAARAAARIFSSAVVVDDGADCVAVGGRRAADLADGDREGFVGLLHGVADDRDREGLAGAAGGDHLPREAARHVVRTRARAEVAGGDRIADRGAGSTRQPHGEHCVL